MQEKARGVELAVNCMRQSREIEGGGNREGEGHEKM